jgi:4-diphosphocytidyl-2-C-methyl-D-erythritol kinase
LGNDLEDPVIKRFPVISVMKKALLDLGALGALMTGSGSSVFGLFPDADGVQRAVLNLAPQPEWQIFATRLLIHSDC